MAEVKSNTKRANIITLILAILAGALMLFSGIGKFSGSVDLSPLGVPAWAVPVIGAIEAIGAIMLFIPRTRFFGAAGLTGVMIGALGAHLIAADWAGVIAPVIPGALLAYVAWRTRPEWVQQRLGGTSPA